MLNTNPQKAVLFLTILFQSMTVINTYGQNPSRPLHDVDELSSMTQQAVNIEEVVNNLFLDPECFIVTNIKTNDNGNGIATFDPTDNLNIGLNSGIMLSTGNVSQIFGTNTGSSDASSNNNLGSDPDLAAIVPFPIYNAVSIEFDFIPTSDKMAFKLVFGSEEYPEYVCSRYNDAIGIFLEKLGTTEKANVAYIPGTNMPISINTLNNGQPGLYGNNQLCLSLDHADMYVDNAVGSTNTRLDGYSTPLSMQIDGMETCAQYRLKIVIADGADQALDSAIFIENESIVGGNGLVIEAEGYYQDGSQRAVERCEPSFFTFIRPENYPLDVDYVIDLSYSGTATFGVDYEPLPSQITIPAGQKEYILNVFVNMDFGLDLFEDDETIVVTTNSKLCSCDRDYISQYLTIENRMPYTLDIVVCPGDEVVLPDGTVVTESGGYTGPYEVDPNYPDCDQVYYAWVTFTPIPDDHFYINFCPESEYILPNGTEVFEDGEYVFNYTSLKNGCDSIVTYHVSLHEESITETSVEICEGDEFIMPGSLDITYPEVGEYSFTWVGSTMYGCDSTVISNVKVHPSYEHYFVEEFCTGDTFTDDKGNLITQSTFRSYRYTTNYGCDSLVNKTYIFHQNDVIHFPDTQYFCEDDLTDSDLGQFDKIGTYEEQYTNQFGCDSTVIFKYEVIKSDFTETPIDLCGIQEFTLPSGKHVTESGFVQDTLQNRYGCDSIVMYNVQMHQVLLANAFSPNNDGMNDQLFISNPDVCGLEEFKLQVFDRWGTEIYSSNNIGQLWDGKLKNGKKATIDIYLVLCEFAIEDEMGQSTTSNISGLVHLLH